MIKSSGALRAQTQCDWPNMKEIVSDLLHELGRGSKTTNIIPWSTPVPSFGDPSRSLLATVGLNPSNKEFVDDNERELLGTARRFHTLTSLGLGDWTEAHEQHHQVIVESCKQYFSSNPYDRWFRTLDFIISGNAVSYYSEQRAACHLDIVPFATGRKWSDLTRVDRARLLEISGDTLGRLVRDSPIRALVLNGSGVVDHFERASSSALAVSRKKAWDLPRGGGRGVAGYAYRGVVRELAGVCLNRDVLVLGYNHNIQSSFGVTAQVKSAIRRWVAQSTRDLVS